MKETHSVWFLSELQVLPNGHRAIMSMRERPGERPWKPQLGVEKRCVEVQQAEASHASQLSITPLSGRTTEMDVGPESLVGTRIPSIPAPLFI